MLEITVCIGSSCHIKGSRQAVEQLRYLISENKLGDKVELGGTFCGGCIGGAGCLTHGEKNKAEVDKYGRKAFEKTIGDAVSQLK